MIRNLFIAFLKDCVSLFRGESKGSSGELEKEVLNIPPENFLENFSKSLSWARNFSQVIPPKVEIVEIFFKVLSNALSEEFENFKNFEHTWNLFEIRKEYARISEIYGFLRRYSNLHSITVQTPVLPDEKLVSEISKKFREMHPYAFVRFTVEKSLLGGMRIFDGGMVYDYSWKKKIREISKYTERVVLRV